MPLLDRTRNGPKLNDAGRALVCHAEAAVARLEQAEHECEVIAGMEGGELRIASFPSASASLLTNALATFSRSHPGVRLTVTEAEPQDSLPRLRAAEVDLAIVFDYPLLPPGREWRDVERTLLLTESMYVTLPRGHPLAEAEVVELADLAEEPWMCGVCPSSCGDVVKQALRGAGFDPLIAFESDEYEVQQAYVAAGPGSRCCRTLPCPPCARTSSFARPSRTPRSDGCGRQPAQRGRGPLRPMRWSRPCGPPAPVSCPRASFRPLRPRRTLAAARTAPFSRGGFRTGRESLRVYVRLMRDGQLQGPDLSEDAYGPIRGELHGRAPQLFPLANTPLLFYALETIRNAQIEEVVIAAGVPEVEELREAIGDGSEWDLEVAYLEADRGSGPPTPSAWPSRLWATARCWCSTAYPSSPSPSSPSWSGSSRGTSTPWP